MLLHSGSKQFRFSRIKWKTPVLKVNYIIVNVDKDNDSKHVFVTNSYKKFPTSWKLKAGSTVILMILYAQAWL